MHTPPKWPASRHCPVSYKPTVQLNKQEVLSYLVETGDGILTVAGSLRGSRRRGGIHGGNNGSKARGRHEDEDENVLDYLHGGCCELGLRLWFMEVVIASVRNRTKATGTSERDIYIFFQTSSILIHITRFVQRSLVINATELPSLTTRLTDAVLVLQRTSSHNEHMRLWILA